MSFDRQYVLCFGMDDVLIDTRRQLLQRAGYAALATTDMSTIEECLLSGEVTVLVLCHSLPSVDLEAVMKFHTETHSSASILRLSRGQIYAAENGPVAFLAAVEKLRDLSDRTVHAQ